MRPLLNQSTENLLQVINDILDISKIETGQLKIKPELFNCRPIVQDLLRITQQQLDKSNKTAIKLIHQCDYNDQPVEIYADKIRFTQIFNNLLSNAVKFTIKEKSRSEFHKYPKPTFAFLYRIRASASAPTSKKISLSASDKKMIHRRERTAVQGLDWQFRKNWPSKWAERLR